MTEDEIRAERRRIVRSERPPGRDAWAGRQRGVFIYLPRQLGEATVVDGPGDDAAEVIDLMLATRDALRREATRLGVVNGARMTKRQLVESVLAARRGTT